MLDLLWHNKEVKTWKIIKNKDHQTNEKPLYKKKDRFGETTMYLTFSGSVVKLTKRRG